MNWQGEALTGERAGQQLSIYDPALDGPTKWLFRRQVIYLGALYQLANRPAPTEMSGTGCGSPRSLHQSVDPEFTSFLQPVPVQMPFANKAGQILHMGRPSHKWGIDLPSAAM